MIVARAVPHERGSTGSTLHPRRADIDVTHAPDWPSIAALLEREVETIMDALAEARAEHIRLKAAMSAKAPR